MKLELIENVKWKPKHREASSCNSIIHQSMNDCTVASWKGTESMFHFVIPWSARDTYQGRLIEVEHTLRIKAITECCMTNPSTEMYITITRPPFLESALSMPQHVQGGSMLSPLDETESASESLMNGNEPMIVDAITLPDRRYGIIASCDCEGAAHAADAWAKGVTYPVLPTDNFDYIA